MKQTGSESQQRQRTALVATPDPKAARLVSVSLNRLSVSTSVVSDGRSVINHLTSVVTEDGDRTVPDLLILDHSLADIQRETVIDAIKSSPRLGPLPIVLFMSDSRATDGEDARALDVNARITTPADEEAYVDVVEALATFWFEHATFPT